jgi:predicted Fe-Mo cluster-binding NifX family protein
VIENPNRDALFDAGSETADLLDSKGVTLLVASNIGSRLIEALREKKMAHIEFTGTVADGLKHALDKQKMK